jgi:hypothetical protein
MLKKTIIGLVVSCSLASNVFAGQLKDDMDALAVNLSEIQMGFFTNDIDRTLKSTKILKSHVHRVLGNEKLITKLLPEAVKYKASIALNSAQIIERNVNVIETTLNDSKEKMINKQMTSQKAFAEIQNQCFRCHNLVRDW